MQIVKFCTLQFQNDLPLIQLYDYKRVMLVLPPTRETISFAIHLRKIKSSADTVINNPMDGNLNQVVRKRFRAVLKNFIPFNFGPPKMMDFLDPFNFRPPPDEN